MTKRPFELARRCAGCVLALVALLPAQKSLVGVLELEPGLVHPLILTELPAARSMEGLALGLHESVPLEVVLARGKRPGEYRMKGRPKLGKSRLILPGLLNARLEYPGRKRRAVRFELTEAAAGGLRIKNHCGSWCKMGGFEVTFVDLDHDGALGSTVDGYVVKKPKQKQWRLRSGGIDLRAMTAPIVHDGTRYWFQVDAPGFQVIVSDAEPDRSEQRAEDCKAALEFLNATRRRLGFAPVALDPELSAACVEHALYCATNGELTHDQDPKKPGYSKVGARAGKYSELTYSRSMRAGVRIWLGTFYHRIKMLSPHLRRVGMGVAQGVAVLDAKSAQRRGDFEPFVWPPDGATGIPCRWLSGEWPSPIGVEPFDAKTAKHWGYPISMTFPVQAVHNVQAFLRLGGVELGTFQSSPERPGNPRIPVNQASILVMAKAPLPPDSEILVEIRYERGGKAERKEWSFRTAR